MILQQVKKVLIKNSWKLIIFGLITNLLMLIPAFYLMSLYDTILPSQSLETLFSLTIITLVATLFLYGFDTLKTKILTDHVFNIQDKEIQNIAMAAMINNQQGYQVPGILARFDNASQTVSGPVIAALIDIPYLPIYAIFLLLLNPYLGIFCLMYGALVIYMAFRKEHKVKTDSQTAARELQNTNTRFERYIQAAALHFSLGWARKLIDQYLAKRVEYAHIKFLSSEKEHASGNQQKATMAFLPAFIGFIAGFLILEGVASIGVIFAANILFMRMVSPVYQLVTSWIALKTAFDDLSYVDRNLDDASDILKQEGGPLTVLPMRLENVWVMPGGAKDSVLKGIDFEIQQGAMTVVVGPNGSGKSTLLKLIGGGLRPKNGFVYLAGVPSANYSPFDLAEKISFVPQNGLIIEGTIKENIFGLQEATEVTDHQLWEWLGVFNLVDSINVLPDGLDTQLTDLSPLLSGGERQKISLIRAFIRKPELILLDEPTNNLDEDSINVLMGLLAKYKKSGCAIVVVTHDKRLFSITDSVVALKQGRIVNNEPIQNLLKK